MSGRCVSLAAGLVLAAAAGNVVSAQETALEYPVVFETRTDLEALEISVGLVYGGGATSPKPTFPNACYSYNGEGGYKFSVSDKVLAHYRAKGFTRESLCLALVSFAYYDPETGKRMPTFAVLEDTTTRKAAIEALNSELLLSERSWLISEGVFESEGALKAAVQAVKRGEFGSLTRNQLAQIGLTSGEAPTNELPLAVPGCFKNGTPFLDCNWRYSMITGKKLSDATRKRQREFGVALDRLMQDTIKSKSFPDPAPHPDGYLLNDGDIVMVAGVDDKQEPIFFSRVPVALFNAAQEPMTFIDVSPAFPRGYGHALHSTGEKDNEISVGALPGQLARRKKSSRYGGDYLRRLVIAR